MSGRLAWRYVALVLTRTREGRTLTDPAVPIEEGNKREAFRLGKRVARAVYGHGTIVELRAESATGGLIERQRLDYEGGRVRWRQAFET